MNDLRATYRLQFRNGMTFQRAAELVPYLTDLGISHLYASPIFRAAPGSTHGYDVADHQNWSRSWEDPRASAAWQRHCSSMVWG